MAKTFSTRHFCRVQTSLIYGHCILCVNLCIMSISVCKDVCMCTCVCMYNSVAYKVCYHVLDVIFPMPHDGGCEIKIIVIVIVIDNSF